MATIQNRITACTIFGLLLFMAGGLSNASSGEGKVIEELAKQAESQASAGQLDKASATLERALRLAPKNPDLWQQLAEIRARQGQTEQARALLEKSKQLAGISSPQQETPFQEEEFAANTLPEPGYEHYIEPESFSEPDITEDSVANSNREIEPEYRNKPDSVPRYQYQNPRYEEYPPETRFVVSRPYIPYSQLPPRGFCRIWFPGLPIEYQPPPGYCDELERQVPPNAYLISR